MDWWSLFFAFIPALFIIVMFWHRDRGVAFLMVIVLSLVLFYVVFTSMLFLPTLTTDLSLPPEYYHDYIKLNESVSKTQQYTIIIHNTTVHQQVLALPIIKSYRWYGLLGYQEVPTDINTYHYLFLSVNNISYGEVFNGPIILNDYHPPFPLNQTTTFNVTFTLSLPPSITNVSNETIFVLPNLPIQTIEYGKTEKPKEDNSWVIFVILAVIIIIISSIIFLVLELQERRRRRHREEFRRSLYGRHSPFDSREFGDFLARVMPNHPGAVHNLPDTQGDYTLREVVKSEELQDKINKYREQKYWTKVVNPDQPNLHAIYLSNWKQTETGLHGIPRWKHPRRET